MKVRISRPVMVGDTITIEGKVVALADGKLTAELSAKNQKGDEVLKNTLVEARV